MANHLITHSWPYSLVVFDAEMGLLAGSSGNCRAHNVDSTSPRHFAKARRFLALSLL